MNQDDPKSVGWWERRRRVKRLRQLLVDSHPGDPPWRDGLKAAVEAVHALGSSGTDAMLSLHLDEQISPHLRAWLAAELGRCLILSGDLERGFGYYHSAVQSPDAGPARSDWMCSAAELAIHHGRPWIADQYWRTILADPQASPDMRVHVLRRRFLHDVTRTHGVLGAAESHTPWVPAVEFSQAVRREVRAGSAARCEALREAASFLRTFGRHLDACNLLSDREALSCPATGDVMTEWQSSLCQIVASGNVEAAYAALRAYRHARSSRSAADKPDPRWLAVVALTFHAAGRFTLARAAARLATSAGIAVPLSQLCPGTTLTMESLLASSDPRDLGVAEVPEQAQVGVLLASIPCSNCPSETVAMADDILRAKMRGVASLDDQYTRLVQTVFPGYRARGAHSAFEILNELGQASASLDVLEWIVGHAREVGAATTARALGGLVDASRAFRAWSSAVGHECTRPAQLAVAKSFLAKYVQQDDQQARDALDDGADDAVQTQTIEGRAHHLCMMALAADFVSFRSEGQSLLLSARKALDHVGDVLERFKLVHDLCTRMRELNLQGPYQSLYQSFVREGRMACQNAYRRERGWTSEDRIRLEMLSYDFSQLADGA